jgi:large subunit ribosomal protein L15
MTAKDTAEVRLHALAKLDAEIIDLAALKAANIVPIFAKQAKVIVSGKLTSRYLRGLALTARAPALRYWRLAGRSSSKHNGDSPAGSRQND